MQELQPAPKGLTEPLKEFFRVFFVCKRFHLVGYCNVFCVAWNKINTMAKKFLSVAIAVKPRISQWSSVTMAFFGLFSPPKNSDWCSWFGNSPVPCQHIVFAGKVVPLVDHQPTALQTLLKALLL
jgi:hypothetical protein